MHRACSCLCSNMPNPQGELCFGFCKLQLQCHYGDGWIDKLSVSQPVNHKSRDNNQCPRRCYMLTAKELYLRTFLLQILMKLTCAADVSCSWLRAPGRAFYRNIAARAG